MMYLKGFMLSAPLNKITSMQNPKIKAIVKLRNKRERDKTNCYLIEGYRELLRARGANTPIETFFICRDLFLGENEEVLIEEIKEAGAFIIECEKSIFEKISYRDRPDGLLAIAKQTPLKLSDLKVSKCPFIVIGVSIEKPGNLGTILRSADAAGADAIIVVDKVTDIYNPNVVRASVGTLFTKPVVQASTDEIFSWLKENKIQIITTSPSAKKIYTEINYKLPTAIVVGSEQYGLPASWLERADQNVFIPMKGVADSLNAATSTTLMLYEVLRQRAGH